MVCRMYPWTSILLIALFTILGDNIVNCEELLGDIDYQIELELRRCWNGKNRRPSYSAKLERLKEERLTVFLEYVRKSA